MQLVVVSAVRKAVSAATIIFTPTVDLKDELASTAVQITCYDRDGKEVKRVTSTSGEVEDPENGGDNGGGNSPVPTNGDDEPNDGD